MRRREEIRPNESTKGRGRVRWGPSERTSKQSVDVGEETKGRCIGRWEARDADHGLIYTQLKHILPLPLKTPFASWVCSLCHGAVERPESPGVQELNEGEGRRECRLGSGMKWINPRRSCSQLLTQAGFIAKQGAINKALWLWGGGCAGFKCATLKDPFAISCVSKLFEVIHRCVCACLWPHCGSAVFQVAGARHKSGPPPPEGSAHFETMTLLFPVCCAVHHIVRAAA